MNCYLLFENIKIETNNNLNNDFLNTVKKYTKELLKNH